MIGLIDDLNHERFRESTSMSKPRTCESRGNPASRAHANAMDSPTLEENAFSLVIAFTSGAVR